ncbi:hypothetical protein HG535_0D04500 [Zygotorulaspora mrakii]|uniref:Sensitive to high expression protein 9, mitochondrial n=1 Tax=Zygotorulaspora mrakii TaxID=42260 RepID=A0A7H9B262_ZYGMR|nr:uncharacterized protein HG535_0D04500 [Zygotorulaspora mrakii]QLG72741.1 hypothetical protein HG535_0D04500 [Zygotorulaspora mrakii]
MLLRCRLRPLVINHKCPCLSVIRLASYRSFSKTTLVLEASDPKGARSTTKEHQKSLGNIAEPYWRAFTSRMQQYKSAVARIKHQFSIHAKKAQDSIREANQKLAEQERNRMDTRLNYDKDIETSRRIVDLPSQREVHRRQWSRKLEFYLDSLQETVLTATKALNDVTGYTSIQKLRKSIDLMEHNLEQNRTYLKSLKARYATAIEQRTESQRELNELLQRKSSWSPADLERFTKLYKDDAMNLKRERDLKEEVRIKDSEQEELINDLYHAILTRYHEEQIWSDKIRRTSTWGTFILMGVNIVLFLVFQLLLEPWKRRRLTKSFEDKVKRALDQYSIEQTQKFEELSSNLKESGNLEQSKTKEKDSERTVTFEENASLENSSHHSEVLPGVKVTTHHFPAEDMSFSRIYHWLVNFATKLKPSTVLRLDSVFSLSSIELYLYSALLLFLGALSGSIL